MRPPQCTLTAGHVQQLFADLITPGAGHLG